jgi:hypothetical protein
MSEGLKVAMSEEWEVARGSIRISTLKSRDSQVQRRVINPNH